MVLVHGCKGNIHLYLDTFFSTEDPEEESSQGAQGMCIETANHKLLPTQDRALSKPCSFRQLGQ